MALDQPNAQTAGAETVTECFVDTVFSYSGRSEWCSSFDAIAAVRRGIEQARLMIALQALEEGRKSSDFACTVVGCLIHLEGAVFGQIGDGAAVYALQDEPCTWQAAVWPDHGEFINTTTFVTCAGAFDRLRLVATCRSCRACLPVLPTAWNDWCWIFASDNHMAPFLIAWCRGWLIWAAPARSLHSTNSFAVFSVRQTSNSAPMMTHQS